VRLLRSVAAIAQVAALLELVEPAFAKEAAEWRDPVDGDWRDSERWQPREVPDAESNAIVAVPGAPFTILIRDPAEARRLSLRSPDATVVIRPGGELQVPRLDLEQGTLFLDGGRLIGARVDVQQGRLTFSELASNFLDRVTIEGPLDLGLSPPRARVRLGNRTRVEGDVIVGADWATLIWDQSSTLHGRLVLSGPNAALGLSGSHTLTLGQDSRLELGFGARIVSDLHAGGDSRSSQPGQAHARAVRQREHRA
jgi:hypothetical protein